MKRHYFIASILILILSGVILAGCNAEGDNAAAGNNGVKATGSSANETYEDYIHAALDAVNNDPNAPVEEAAPAEEPGRIVHVKDTDDSVYVSAVENLPEESGVVPNFGANTFTGENGETFPGSPDAADSNESLTPTPTPTPTGTPDTFDVGVCCIYIKCEDDSGYGSEVVTAINKARTDLGYPELKENTGLATCANRRTREVASYLSHTRPNKEPFYSLAPEYFKAEMLGIGRSKSDATFDAWMTDPESRDLIFTTQYGSIGAHCIKVNDFYCVVVAFGD